MLAPWGNQRHAQIAFDAHFGERLVQWKPGSDAGWPVTQVALDHFFARCSGKVVLDVFAKFSVLPESQRANAIFGGELGEQRIAAPERLGKMLDERLKVCLAGRVRGL